MLAGGNHHEAIMKFSELMQGEGNTLSVPGDWGQARAVFGGLVAALVLRAMRNRVEASRPLRSLATTFVAPLACDSPVSVEVEVLREGKSVSQVLGRALQAGATVALVQGSFGSGRASAVALGGPQAPAMPAVEQCQPLPHLPGVTPEFIRHLALRWGLGGLPYTGNPSREIGGWVQLRDEQEAPLDELHLLALVDAWPPATLSQLNGPAPGSTLTWTIEFIQPLPAMSTRDWYLYRAVIEQARDGYGHVAAALWSATGEPLALSRQVVTIFG
jgi:acyl-CoA thioesterase